jgi:protein-tyrosine phosphatase
MRLYNFRDIGGLQTKCQREIIKGQLFRTANMAHLTELEAEQLIDKHKIQLYIDFRGMKEIDSFAGRPQSLLSQNVKWANLCINADDPDFGKIQKPEVDDWIRLYRRLFEQNLNVWSDFVKLLKETDGPIAYGCLFGKDRTGVATSLLLDLLNVDDHIITHNYSETTTHVMPVYEQFRHLWEDLALTETEIFNHYLTAKPEIIKGFLDYMRSHPEETLVGQKLKELKTQSAIELQKKYLRSMDVK